MTNNSNSNTNKKAGGFTMTNEQEKIIDKALDYILNIIKRQGFIPSKREIFGDGTMFKGLSQTGFEWCYESCKEAVEQLSFQANATK